MIEPSMIILGGLSPSPYATMLNAHLNLVLRRVQRLRPHFRSAKHQHIVQLVQDRPVYTFILTGPKSKEWGFWKEDQFVHHEQWLSGSNGDPSSQFD